MEDSPTRTYPSASLLRRTAAIIYDTFLVVAISMAYAAVILATQVLLLGVETKDYTPTSSGPLFQLGWFLSVAGFYYYFWRKSGQTAGMRAWRLKMVDRKGHLASSRQCAYRVLLAPPALLVFGLGYLARKKRSHRMVFRAPGSVMTKKRMKEA